MKQKTVLGVAGLTGLLAGCAVLTVDVDVYKGPLANDESVQVEQLGAMVTAARPLLTALRDRLPGKSGNGVGAADLIDAVLTLYDDRDTLGVETFLAEAKSEVRKYEQAFDVLHARRQPLISVKLDSSTNTDAEEVLNALLNPKSTNGIAWRDQNRLFQWIKTNANNTPNVNNTWITNVKSGTWFFRNYSG